MPVHIPGAHVPVEAMTNLEAKRALLWQIQNAEILHAKILGLDLGIASEREVNQLANYTIQEMTKGSDLLDDLINHIKRTEPQ